jgi:hypothetical protein
MRGAEKREKMIRKETPQSEGSSKKFVVHIRQSGAVTGPA